jgi:predicted nucleic acid-binding protein
MRVSPLDLLQCEELLQSCFEVTLTPGILDRAGLLEPASLTSLDAIHLACALLLGDELDEFVAYDERLAEAAVAAGLRVSGTGPR